MIKNFETIKINFDEPVEKAATLTFSIPKRLNAISSLVVQEFDDALDLISNNLDRIRAHFGIQT